MFSPKVGFSFYRLNYYSANGSTNEVARSWSTYIYNVNKYLLTVTVLYAIMKVNYFTSCICYREKNRYSQHGSPGQRAIVFLCGGKCFKYICLWTLILF